jgi:hypothetical protein
MRTTLTLIITTAALAAVLTTVTAQSAFAGDDLPSGPGIVSDSVQLTGTYEGTGVMGGLFSRERVTRSGTVLQSGLFDIADDYQAMAHVRLCAGGNYMFDIGAGVLDRTDDGAVLVGAVIFTRNDCFPRTTGSARHAGSEGWIRELVWVAPGESETIDLLVNEGNGVAELDREVAPLPPTQLPDSTSEIPNTSSEPEELPLINLTDVVTPLFNFDTGTTLNF